VRKNKEKLTFPVILRKCRTLRRILLSSALRLVDFLWAIPRRSWKILRIIRREGWRALWYFIEERFGPQDRELYELWKSRHRLTSRDQERILKEIESLPFRPFISILLPVYNTDEVWLRRCLD